MQIQGILYSWRYVSEEASSVSRFVEPAYGLLAVRFQYLTQVIALRTTGTTSLPSPGCHYNYYYFQNY